MSQAEKKRGVSYKRNCVVNTRDGKELGVFKICEDEANMVGRQCNSRISIYDSSIAAGATAAETE